VGGSRPFLQLVELAGLQSPFEPGGFHSAVDAIREWLEEAEV